MMENTEGRPSLAQEMLSSIRRAVIFMQDVLGNMVSGVEKVTMQGSRGYLQLSENLTSTTNIFSSLAPVR